MHSSGSTSSNEPALFCVDCQSSTAASQHLSKCTSTRERAHSISASLLLGHSSIGLDESLAAIQFPSSSQSGAPLSFNGEIRLSEASGVMREGESRRTLQMHSSAAFPRIITGGIGPFSLSS